MRTKNKQIDYIALVDELKRIPIIQIFDRYIGGKLRHHGKKAVTACPWHGRDSSPSLTFYTDRNNWYCYGCQRGGTNIDLVMQSLGADFKTAVAAIARDFGLSADKPDHEVRKKIRQQQERRNVDVAFEADYERVYLNLLKLRNSIAARLRSYEDYEQNQELVHLLPAAEGALDEMIVARTQVDRLRAWRIARKVLLCRKT